MSLAAPKVNPGAQAAAPAAQGADALQLGSASDSTTTRTQGSIGRLALRVGPQTPTTSTSSSGM